MARCPGLKLTPRARVSPGAGATLKLTCDIDCVYSARAGRRTAHGRAVGGVAATLRFRRLAPGSYVVRLTLAAPLNPGPPRRLSTRLVVESG